MQDLVVLLEGTARTISIKVHDSRNQPVENGLVTWNSDDTAIVKVAAKGNCGPGASPGCYRTSVYAIRSGTAKVTATIDGISAKMTVEVPAIVAGATGISATFDVIEYRQNTYAPFIRVMETSGKSRAEILGILISIPGVDGPRRGSWLCTGSAVVEASTATDLIREVYGEYQLTFGGGNRTSDIANATLYVRREPGIAATLELTARIVPGSLPSTYSGLLASVWDCL